jgi:hypothetical protein
LVPCRVFSHGAIRAIGLPTSTKGFSTCIFLEASGNWTSL